MISQLLLILALSTLAIAQDCGGDTSLGCMDDTECTVGACVRADPADFLGCCTAPTTTAPAAATTTVAGGGTTNSSCADLLNPQTGVSDCPARSYLCKDSVYLQVMQQQCPRTCGYCSGAGSTSTNSTGTSSSSCVVLKNPSTGVSDCPARNECELSDECEISQGRAYCTNTAYTSLMRTQCPSTCGFCTSTGGGSSSGTATGGTLGGPSTSCADKVNPNTGVSDCPNMRGYCNDPVYQSLMRDQCPKSCGFCSSG